MDNTLSSFHYVKDSYLFAVLMFLAYGNMIFKPIPGISYRNSMFILYGICAVVTTSGVYFTRKRGRNYINILVNVINSWGIYAILAYGNDYKLWFRIVIVFFAVLAIVMSMTVILYDNKIAKNVKENKARKTRKIVMIIRQNMFIATLLLIIPLYLSLFLGTSEVEPTVASTTNYGEEHSFVANMEHIVNFEQERWKNLDIQQKLDICQRLINCEGNYLGLTHQVDVVAIEIPGTVLGSYSEEEYLIRIDKEHLEKSIGYDVMGTILHECAHAYQYEQVDIYMVLDEKYKKSILLYPASIYKEEFSNYKSTSNGDSYEHYYYQRAEMDARDLAKTHVAAYKEMIEAYLYSKGE